MFFWFHGKNARRCMKNPHILKRRGGGEVHHGCPCCVYGEVMALRMRLSSASCQACHDEVRPVFVFSKAKVVQNQGPWKGLFLNWRGGFPMFEGKNTLCCMKYPSDKPFHTNAD